MRKRKISFAKCSDCKKTEAKERYLLGREARIVYGKNRRREKYAEIKDKKRLKYLSQRKAVLEKAKDYYEANKEAVIERGKAYRKKPATRERILEKNRIRRTLVRSLEDSSDITIDFILALKREQKNCCLCSVELYDHAGKNQRHLDHIIPIHIGGAHMQDNVRYTCRTCNLKRPKDGRDIKTLGAKKIIRKLSDLK